jgi:hypothetical protein
MQTETVPGSPRKKIILGIIAGVIVVLGLSQLSLWLVRANKLTQSCKEADSVISALEPRLAALENDTVRKYAYYELQSAAKDVWYARDDLNHRRAVSALAWTQRAKDDIAVVNARMQHCQDSIAQRRPAAQNKKH